MPISSAKIHFIDYVRTADCGAALPVFQERM